MAYARIFQTLKINGNNYKIKACWESLTLTKKYMLALLSRDEYTPVIASKPAETDTIYMDPVSGNPAGFHSGQCACYPDKDANNGCGLSIIKSVTVDQQNTPVSMTIFNATDVEKRIGNLEKTVSNGCFGNGLWYNTLKWQDDVVWNNGG